MNIRAPSIFEPPSDVSSIASDLSLRDGHDRIEFQQFGHGQPTFDMLQDSESSHETDGSQGSGTSIYVDAPTKPEDGVEAPSLERFRQHLMSPSSSSSKGLVAVTPIKPTSPWPRQPGSAHLQSPPTPDMAATSSYLFSPQTPRLRKGPRAGPVQPLPPPPPPPLGQAPQRPSGRSGPGRGPQEHTIQYPPERSHGIEEVPVPSSHARAPSADRVSSRTSSIRLTFGPPRKVSDSRSLHSHGSQVSDEGHIEPNRQVGYQPLSYIKRSGRTINSRTSYLAGLPRLPTLPAKSPCDDLELEKRDMWGRKQASPRTAWLVLLLCTGFPPLWLLISAGYFDSLYGVFPRTIKLVAMALALLVLAAVIALVSVFGVLRT